MLSRQLTLPKNRNFFLFGARNTGKSTLIERYFPKSQNLWIDLLDPRLEARFTQNPAELYEIITSLPDDKTHVIIDEIQKVPKLLDVVHSLMKDKTRQFVLTGSSARKLKAGGANLLAGRAFVYHLYPFTHTELGEQFNLQVALNWGTLPEIAAFDSAYDRVEFLNAYARTYLKEEIWEEGFIRDLAPFRRFLEVAAQMNGKIINFSKIAHTTGINDKTVKTYFSILEDTLIGFYLDAHHNSVRKQVSQKPKFYFFDTGVARALANQLDVPLTAGTHAYGNAFEHFIITECLRIASYQRLNYKFSYIRTRNDVEVDLVIERPNKTTIYLEIKSSDVVDSGMLTNFINLTKHIDNTEAICLSNDPFSKKIAHITTMHWREALQYIFY